MGCHRLAGSIRSGGGIPLVCGQGGFEFFRSGKPRAPGGQPQRPGVWSRHNVTTKPSTQRQLRHRIREGPARPGRAINSRKSIACDGTFLSSKPSFSFHAQYRCGLICRWCSSCCARSRNHSMMRSIRVARDPLTSSVSCGCSQQSSTARSVSTSFAATI